MKISIITVCYMAEKTIAKTIESVLKQDYDCFEHIFVDGLSKDLTVEVIQSYSKRYNGRLKVISEPDGGIYDAMNKGILMASGDVIGLLNADDIYTHKRVLSLIAEAINAGADGVYSNLKYVDYHSPDPKKVRRVFLGTGNVLFGWMPPHPTLYLKRDVYEKHGKYRTDLAIASDYDYILRIFLDTTLKFHYVKTFFITMSLGGVSTAGLKSDLKNIKEILEILRLHKIAFPEMVILLRILRTISQKTVECWWYNW